MTRSGIMRNLKKAVPAVCRLSAAAAVTCLYSLWAIEQAYIRRGYKAYGGEYLSIPLVAWAIYDILTVLTKMIHAIRAWRRETEGI